MTAQMRRATADDQKAIERALFAAWHWRDPFDERAFEEHQRQHSSERYVDDFGKRSGDCGVIAERDGMVLGVAWYRFFTADDHGVGYVSEEVPELLIAVDAQSRGHGVGTILVGALIEAARDSGVARLSLHVSRENVRARRLYEGCGFAEVIGGDRGVVMTRSTTAAVDV